MTHRVDDAHFSLRDDVVAELDDKLSREQADERLPSFIVGIGRAGELSWWGARGSGGLAGGVPADIDTQYRIGSISKTFAAVAVMRMRDEGLLDLNDHIGEHLPELAELPVTVGQLLSHTSGLRAETNGPWWERTPGISFADLVASTLRPADLLARPGRRFHYSNPGFAVVGELAARKRGVPFGEVVRTELWEPLGMNRTSLRPVAPHAEGLAVHPHSGAVLVEPEHDAVSMAPAGQLWSTIADLARWSAVLAGDRAEILDPETAAEMQEPIGILDVPDQAWTVGYGLGLQLWNTGGKRRYGHAGAMPGHMALCLIDAHSKCALAAAANTTYSGFRPAFFEEMLTLLIDGTREPHDEFRPSLADPALLELTGSWYFGPVEVAIGIGTDGDLELRGVPRPARDCDFHPNGDGSYTGRFGYYTGERLEVVRRADGSVSHLDIASFIFTRLPYDASAYVPGGVDDRGWS
jgi:CubicO group peptidase (beta-lactamase class C family)